MEHLTTAQKKDLKILINFVRVYCRAKHGDREKTRTSASDLAGRETILCGECTEIVDHALVKRRNCPLTPKPSCKNCHIHCYGKDYRAKIREIMAFSGRRMILAGRLDYALHYFF